VWYERVKPQALSTNALIPPRSGTHEELEEPCCGVVLAIAQGHTLSVPPALGSAGDVLLLYSLVQHNDPVQETELFSTAEAAATWT
jgi:hypothetical protein